MASFFETYKQSVDVSFSEYFFGSATTVARYTCPANHFAYVFVTAASIDGDPGYNVSLAYYNSSRPDEKILFKGLSPFYNSNASLGMLILKPGETVYTIRDGGIPFMIASGTIRIFLLSTNTL